ncbi:MAG: UvrD-helicase domain-containing protein [Spirochaetia bacterium]|nr:UvrD-helicase domain-containing protein [Spirochaetia bacterium]
MPLNRIIGQLSEDQKLAATAVRSVVVAAGAGSGKTKTLAARYAWLVMEKGLKVDEILTLTFTNKAVNEMYARIYNLLQEQGDDRRAREAIENFHRARISTLDSFCAGIARTAGRRYGISPDFAIDNTAVRQLAGESALPFVLDNRENPALQVLLANKKIRIIAEELFARMVLRHGFVTSPPDFEGFLKNQEEEIKRLWETKTGEASRLIEAIADELRNIANTKSRLYGDLQALLEYPAPRIPDSLSGPQAAGEKARQDFRGYFGFLSKLKSVNLQSGGKEYAAVKELLKELRQPLYEELEAIANTMLQREITAAVFPLAKKFFEEFDVKKRQAGILSFNDVARLAVDALSRYPDIRQAYKDSIKAIMIDEFQDNNSLQRDLVFLLAEKPLRDQPGIPGPDELEEGKMFFVGDEKQSIYRFRGADVSVFRSLAKTIGGEAGAALNLKNNYRSLPVLVEAFNRIFGGLGPEEEKVSGALPSVFLPSGGGLPDFEAAYTRMASFREEAGGTPCVHFCFLDRDRIPEDDKFALSPHELEAVFIARRIREMVDSGHKIARRDGNGVAYAACTYADFAVLQRSYANQHSLEKYCKDFGVPFTADRPAGLFTDAPVNDLYMLLRLLAYPQDRLACAAVMRSPFARLDDRTLALCMTHNADDDSRAGESAQPFAEETADLLPPEAQQAYLRAGERYRQLAQAAETLSVSELLTRLWYQEGYRYETLWSAPAQGYTELFDVLFQLAQNADRQGQSLSGFIDCLEGLASKEEKPDDPDVPIEGERGVRLMSIHRSKGLEFPVVFIYGGNHHGRNDTNTDPIYFHEKWGISLNLPLAEELPEKGGNYFHLCQKEEEKQKTTAELRRLLYVAMTRAESCLYFTSALPGQTKEEKKKEDLSGGEYTEGLVKKRLAQLLEKKQKKGGDGDSSFLDLLLPVLAPADGNAPFTIEAIPVLSRKDLRRLASGEGKNEGLSMREAAAAAEENYERAAAIVPAPALPSDIPASSLHYEGTECDREEPDARVAGADKNLDAILVRAGLEAADFGTIVHGFLEADINGTRAFIPPKILARLDGRLEEEDIQAVRDAAEKMTQGFLESDLGRLSAAASCREAEFSILTQVSLEGKTIPVTGKIDLLFRAEGAMHVVDFKTDSAQDPDRHLGQLAVYSRAVSDIFGVPVRAWLFYLRTRQAVELSADVGKINIEDMVAGHLRDKEKI